MAAEGPLSTMLNPEILLQLHLVTINSIYIESLSRLDSKSKIRSIYYKHTSMNVARVTQQQDVSEFTHKLLDWLEDAFQMQAEQER